MRPSWKPDLSMDESLIIIAGAATVLVVLIFVLAYGRGGGVPRGEVDQEESDWQLDSGWF